MNFGVLEVAASNSKQTAPGWVYVPVAPLAASQPSSRKRVRTDLPASQHETSAKQELKISRELAALDRENYRDVSIPVPIRHRDNAGRVSHGKVTPAVRKILQSQKTFANHLSDFDALAALSSALPTSSHTIPATPAVRHASGTATPNFNSTSKRSHKKKDLNAPAAPGAALRKPTHIKSEDDVPMPDAPILSLTSVADPPAHPRDRDPLLVSRIPDMPPQEEIERLWAAPPLSYHEAKGSWTEEDRRKPVRTFCEVCGYWGRARCTRCGGRVCALECLGVHQEECFTRYGA